MHVAGMVHPSAGDCEILGHSVRHDVAAARQSLGICPQQNVLFGTLTVEEHLVLYAHIKDGLGAQLCVRSPLGTQVCWRKAVSTTWGADPERIVMRVIWPQSGSEADGLAGKVPIHAAADAADRHDCFDLQWLMNCTALALGGN